MQSNLSSPTPGVGQRLIDGLRKRGLSAAFVVLAVISAGILVGSALTSTVHGKENRTSESSDATPLRIPPPTYSDNAFAKIAKAVEPAVVNINTESLPKQGAVHKRGAHPAPNGKGGDDQQQQGDMQDFFNRFFGGQAPGGGGGGDDDENGGGDGGERKALGSGFIVDPRGYIITNNHVVDKADRIFVRLATDPENDPGRPARVIGTDKDTDIAVIKIDAPSPLPTIQLGNSESAQVGDWVLAIGSPFGLSQTVSAGIVSAKNRSIDGSSGPSQFQRFIQTDAAINPGNSGGPLVDMNGHVVGMNTAIYTQGMGSQGVGFAMPSNTVINVYNMLIAPEHKVVRGSIGIQYQSAISSAVSRIYGFEKGGVMISSVTSGGPAAKAGLQAQDIIVAVDDLPIKDGDDLVGNISQRRPGSTVRLTYLRNGERKNATVGIADRAQIYAAIAGAQQDKEDGTPEPDSTQSKLGMGVQTVPQNLAQQQGLTGGVLVTSVVPGSFADESGIERGDVILAINRKVIDGVASLQGIVSGLKSGEDVVFAVRKAHSRDKSNTFIGGTLP